jgi:hypothetical protein
MSEEQRKARPWDLFNKNVGRVGEQLAEERYEICSTCPRLIKLTGQCKECGCFMQQKVKLPHASCPLFKWDPVAVSYTEEYPEKED